MKTASKPPQVRAGDTLSEPRRVEFQPVSLAARGLTEIQRLQRRVAATEQETSVGGAGIAGGWRGAVFFCWRAEELCEDGL